MGRIITPDQSKAFASDSPGNQWTQVALEFLHKHRGELYTSYDLVKELGQPPKLTRDSAITNISLRWLYAGFNDPDDPWLHVHRVRLPSRAFAYRWMAAKRPPERTETPSEAKRRRDAERARKGVPTDTRTRLSPAEAEAALASPVNGAEPGPEVMDTEMGPQRIETTGPGLRRREPEPEVEAAHVVIPEPVVIAPQPPKEGFDLGDLVEVIGFTKIAREPVVRDTAGTLYRITALEF